MDLALNVRRCVPATPEQRCPGTPCHLEKNWDQQALRAPVREVGQLLRRRLEQILNGSSPHDNSDRKSADLVKGARTALPNVKGRAHREITNETRYWFNQRRFTDIIYTSAVPLAGPNDTTSLSS
ncbi:hypothetical protein QE369_001940 [Agrobacterium larrymoorei]|uniref:Transposase n=1 Tax=Agrobacterium larrymoorei TaxID=160699 RepID=A0AAJ2B7E8_9HYPH|nr:hypothetical protein [Agrobacterium larrymoorei]